MVSLDTVMPRQRPIWQNRISFSAKGIILRRSILNLEDAADRVEMKYVLDLILKGIIHDFLLEDRLNEKLPAGLFRGRAITTSRVKPDRSGRDDLYRYSAQRKLHEDHSPYSLSQMSPTTLALSLRWLQLQTCPGPSGTIFQTIIILDQHDVHC